MSKVEVGEYIRFEDGKIVLATQQLKVFIDEHMSRNEKDLVEFLGRIKHSKQLIDLIEIKDLICFKNALSSNTLENEEMIIHIFNNETLQEVKQAVEDEEIKIISILTKEQYMENCFEVGGENE